MSNKNKIIEELQRKLEVKDYELKIKDQAREAERKRADLLEAKLLQSNKSVISASINIIFGKIKQFCRGLASKALEAKPLCLASRIIHFLFNGTKQKKPVPVMLTAVLAIAVIMSSYALINHFLVSANPQLPQNQSFLNLAHKDINPLATTPITYTSTSTQDTQAEFTGTSTNIAKGFGYVASASGNQFIYPSGTSPTLAETSVFFSPRFDMGAKTKMALTNLLTAKPTNTDLRIYVRGGAGLNVNTDSIASTTYLDTTYQDFNDATGTGNGWEVTSGGELKAEYTWVCGTTLTDTRDNKTYVTVQIGTQCWMKQNMNIGTRIAGSSNQGANCTSSSTIQKYCYSDADVFCNAGKNPLYPDGGLYQWGQAMCGSTTAGAQGICPTGWHIPTDAEYKILEMYLGMTQEQADATGWRGTTEGDKLKPAGKCGDRTPCGTSGFEGNLAGLRLTDGSFGLRDSYARIWSSLESGSTSAWFRGLNSSYATVNRSANNKAYGFSIRCLKD